MIISFLSLCFHTRSDVIFGIQIQIHPDRKNYEKLVSLAGELEMRDKGVFVGIEEFDDDNQSKTEDDGLGDIWNEMSLALECSKVIINGKHKWRF